MQKHSVIALLSACVLTLGFAQSASTTKPARPTTEFNGKDAYDVLEVVTGDLVILKLDGRRTRVHTHGVKSPTSVEPYGKESQAWLTNLLKGERVYLEFERGQSDNDATGAASAYVYRAPDGLFVNGEAVRQGYAIHHPNEPSRFDTLFDQHESIAEHASKGLWEKGQPPRMEVAQPPAAVRQSERRVAPPTPPVTKPEQPANDADSVTVYVTKSGGKYHRAGCQYLRKSSIAISFKDAKRSYSPCSRCGPP